MEVLALDFLAGFNNLQQKIVSKIYEAYLLNT